MANFVRCFLVALLLGHIDVSVSSFEHTGYGQIKEDRQNPQQNVCGFRRQAGIFAEEEDSFIVGGDVVTVEHVPWQVSLRYLDGHDCGGTILNSKYIVTAAHCFSALSTSMFDWTIYTAKSVLALDENGEVGPFHIESLNIHPSYKRGSFKHDIALVRLRESMIFGRRMGPVCVPYQGSSIPNGVTCYVSGFGDTKGTGGDGKLKEAMVPVYSGTQCSRMFGTEVSENIMLCAGYPEGGLDACQGDSGGPLFCQVAPGIQRYVLQGIVSFGRSCGQPNLPGVYIRISAYMKWMNWVVSNGR